MVFGVGLRTAVLLGQWLWRLSVSDDDKLGNLMLSADRLADLGLRTKEQPDALRAVTDEMRQRHMLQFPDCRQDLSSQMVLGLGGEDE